MTAPIAPWRRPAFRPTGRRAAITLIAFADEDVLKARPDLGLHDAVPKTAPTAALDLRIHHYADSPSWIDGWRTGALRNIAAQQLDNLDLLDAASCCYSITVEVDDPDRPHASATCLGGGHHARRRRQLRDVGRLCL
ncbi:hypothetical protein [Micromonospora chersina]|uniref:hypothetical protein n=1 Tax=Micromonospora chersina TaxID=47854 RepID=UPI00371F8D52